MGYLAKTDRIDARVLAQMAEVINRHPERGRFIRAMPDAERQVLTAMGVRRRQLITMLVAERNRMHLSHPQSRKSINIIIKALDDELARIDIDMNKHVQSHFKDLAERLISIKGVGAMTAATLLAEVPELGKLSRREISALPEFERRFTWLRSWQPALIRCSRPFIRVFLQPERRKRWLWLFVYVSC